MFFKITIEPAESENSLLTTDRREFRIKDGSSKTQREILIDEIDLFIIKAERKARDK